ncbi:PAAR-like protein [Prevotella melaninogenica]
MSKIITHGATMYCSLGTEKPNLTVTSQTFRRIADALVGTEGDNKGMVNIPSFGVCKCSSPNLPCTPQPQTRLAANNTERQYQ